MSTFEATYRQRVMGAMVLVLALAVLLVRGWPVWAPSDPTSVFRDRPTERIQIRDVQPTSQAKEKTPAPPAPLPPVVVPNEVLIKEELSFGEAPLDVDAPEDDAELQEGAERRTAAQAPDTGARLLRSVQPTYPASAREAEVRARIQVEVQIRADGVVEAATIQERWRIYPDGSSRPVARLGHGLEEAALSAAERSLFRPARTRGRPVATRKRITFTFGPD
jgi:protein TonB